jgi:ABC-type transport system substrate-binding protein
MRKIDHNSFRLVLIIFCGCVLLWGCDDHQDRSTRNHDGEHALPQSGGTYRLPLTKNPASLDPALVHHNYDLTVVQQIFDGLVRFDPYLAPRPSLAETWRIEEDGRVYIFTLRDNARFHNGQRVLAEDVVFTLSRLLRVDPPPSILPHLMRIEGAAAYRRHRADRVGGLQPMGESLLRVRLIQPHVPFLTALGMYQAMVVPQQVVTADPDGFSRKPVGSGPFRFVSWEPDRSIRLERFEQYHGGKSHLDNIHFKIYPKQQNQRVLEDFTRGELDEMPVFSDEVKAALSGRSDLQWFHRPSLSLFFYGINCQHPSLNDPRLRRILSASINRLQLVETVFNGRFETAQTILPPGMPGYNPPGKSLKDYLSEDIAQQSNPAGSSPLLQPIEIVSAYDTPRVRAEMALVEASWIKHGVRLTTKFISDWEKFNAYIRSDAVQIYRYVWYADMPDPDSILYPLFASDSADNFMRFHNPQVDHLLNTARGAMDPVQRADVYRRAEKLILKSSPLIPLFHLSVDQVYHGAVKNIQLNALGAHMMSLRDVWLKRPPSF